MTTRYLPRLGLRALGVLSAMLMATSAFAFQQAPALEERQTAGEIPPLEERLPAEPLVVEPHEAVGTYGGDLNMAIMGPGDWFLLVRSLGYEPLVTWSPDWTEITPNVASQFEVNEDATEFTFHLRDGMKWSDGEPFTADDIIFWFEDVMLNEELNPTVPARLQAGGEPPTLTRVDDNTIRFTFTEPNGLFLQYIAYNRSGLQPTMWPKHYFQQFHIKYNPDANEMAEAEGLADWVELFQQRSSDMSWPWRFNAEVPVLHAWAMNTSLVEGGGAQIVADRNPYYWKVDPEGNQLPYIDRLVYDVVQDAEVILLKALNGEIDMQDRNLGTNANKSVLFDGQQGGDYSFYDIDLSDMNTGVVSLNLTHVDEAKRELFNNKEFRVGLSHAINRQEIIDLIHVGVGEPWQAAPRPDTPIYNEELAKQYTEFDTAQANEILDRVLPEKDGSGMRLMPDGSPLVITLEIADAHGLSFPDVAELVAGYWSAVGVNTQVRVIDRSLLDQRRVSNEMDATIWRGFGGSVDGLVDARWYVPATDDSDYGTAWAYWYDGREDVAAPPQAVQDHLQQYTEVKTAPSLEEQVVQFNELLETSVDQFYVMGISLPGLSYGVVKNGLRNVPQTIAGGGDLPNPAQVRFEQFYWADAQ